MSVPKEHHLLPAFYLRGFCNGELHEGEPHEDNPKRCRVLIHDRDRGKCRGRGVKNRYYKVGGRGAYVSHVEVHRGARRLLEGTDG